MVNFPDSRDQHIFPEFSINKIYLSKLQNLQELKMRKLAIFESMCEELYYWLNILNDVKKKTDYSI